MIYYSGFITLWNVCVGGGDFSRWCHWLFCFQSISDKKKITLTQISKRKTYLKRNYLTSFSLYYNFIVKGYLKCFVNTFWIFHMRFSTTHRAILGHVYSTLKNLILKGVTVIF